MADLSVTDIRDSIKEILKNADLSALSSKAVRKQLENKFGVDLTLRKQEIDDILMSLIATIEDEKLSHDQSADNDSIDDNGRNNNDDANGNDNLSKKSRAFASTTNGASANVSKREHTPSNSSSDIDADDVRESVKKPKLTTKKRTTSDSKAKRDEASSSDDDGIDDEAFARKLQQQELRVRPRSSKQKAERRTRSKGASSEKPARKKGNSLYHQECVLSPELSIVMGSDRMARKDVVSRMWKIFKERELMDPKNKQYVICDEQLEKVFKCKKFKAFGMMKFLKTHIKDAKLVVDADVSGNADG